MCLGGKGQFWTPREVLPPSTSGSWRVLKGSSACQPGIAEIMGLPLDQATPHTSPRRQIGHLGLGSPLRRRTRTPGVTCVPEAFLFPIDPEGCFLFLYVYGFVSKKNPNMGVSLWFPLKHPRKGKRDTHIGGALQVDAVTRNALCTLLERAGHWQRQRRRRMGGGAAAVQTTSHALCKKKKKTTPNAGFTKSPTTWGTLAGFSNEQVKQQERETEIRITIWTWG